jgi:hypothetical protein
MATWINTIGVERVPPLIHLAHEAILAEPYLLLTRAALKR